jgi:hypothetical protein
MTRAAIAPVGRWSVQGLHGNTPSLFRALWEHDPSARCYAEPAPLKQSIKKLLRFCSMTNTNVTNSDK